MILLSQGGTPYILCDKFILPFVRVFFCEKNRKRNRTQYSKTKAKQNLSKVSQATHAGTTATATLRTAATQQQQQQQQAANQQ